MKQEKDYARKHGLRQTPSSGRFGIVKGDSFNRDYAVDNKGTTSFAYKLDVREWLAFYKRSQILGKRPILAIEFERPELQLGRTGKVAVCVVPEDEWWGLIEELQALKERVGRGGTVRKAKPKSSRTTEDPPTRP